MKAKLTKSHPRTVNYLNQVKSSLFYKIAAVGLSFLVITIMVRYLGNEKYGIWSTLLALVSWMLFFDFGLANGTRNKVSESLANDDIQQARIYISTSYVVIGVISLCLFCGLFIVSGWINWQTVFNTKSLSSNDLRQIVIVISFFMLLNFALNIVQQLYHAVQKSSLTVLNQFLSNLFALLFVYAVTRISSGNILYLGWAYGSALLGSNLTLSFFFYSKRPDLLPVLRCFEKRKIKNLLGLGVKFFIIQLAVLVIFTTDKMIITQVFGPEAVTPYDIVFKLFSIVTIAHSIIVAPLWSTLTEAYISEDYGWIKNIITKLNFLMLPFIAVIGLLVITSPFILKVWIGEHFEISWSLVIFMGVFVTMSIWSNIYAYFVNGIGSVIPQLYSSIIAGIINIPLSLFFARKFMNVNGVLLGTIISLSIFAVIGPLQTRSIFKKHTNGGISRVKT